MTTGLQEACSPDLSKEAIPVRLALGPLWVKEQHLGSRGGGF